MKAIVPNLILLLFFCLGIYPSKGQSLSLDYGQTHTLLFTLKANDKKNVEKPEQVVFGATFRHEDGQVFRVEGFYKGAEEKRCYALRFTLPKVGEWTYQTFSEYAALSGQQGKVNIKPSSFKGAIRLDAEQPKAFSYQDGTPYLPLAYELDWFFALDYGKKELTQAKSILKTIKENGFNQILFNVYAYESMWGKQNLNPKYNFSKPNFFPFGGSNENPDYSCLNYTYFNHLDRLMDLLAQEGIQAHLMIYVWNKGVHWPEMYSEADNAYFDHIVKRYQAYPNLIWNVAKEALDYGHNDASYIHERIARIRKLDTHQRLLTVHDLQYCEAFPAQVDFICVQDWSTNLHARSTALYQHFEKAVFNVEHGGYVVSNHVIFQGGYYDAEVSLERNYLLYFAGLYSTHYWQNTSWYELNYEPHLLPKKEQPKLYYFQYFQDFIKRFPLNEFSPLSFPFSSYALGNEQGDLLFYIPEGCNGAFGHLHGRENDLYKVTYFDILTGKSYPMPDRQQNGSWLALQKPTELDGKRVVLILEKKVLRM